MALTGSDSAPTPTGYVIVLAITTNGMNVPAVPDARVVPLTVTLSPDPMLRRELGDATPDDGSASVAPGAAGGVLRALTDAGVTPADLRAKACIWLDPALDPIDAVTAYVACTVFAGRRLSFGTDIKNMVDSARLDGQARLINTDPHPPKAGDDWVQVGAAHPDITTVGVNQTLSAADAELVKAAKRLRVVPAPDPVAAIAQFVVLAGIRARGRIERFPYLVAGTEPVEPGSTSVGLDLDAIRKAAAEQRRTAHTGTVETELVEPVPLTAQQQAMVAAAELPAAAVMVALGTSSPGTGLWHCPRPERHRNRDANASMRVETNTVRCFRCDPEFVDPVRLVADVYAISGAEAVDWLQHVVAPNLPALQEAADTMLNTNTNTNGPGSDSEGNPHPEPSVV